MADRTLRPPTALSEGLHEGGKQALTAHYEVKDTWEEAGAGKSFYPQKGTFSASDKGLKIKRSLDDVLVDP